MGLRESNRVYLIPQTLFHHPKPKINEKMGDLPKLAWSRDVTGKVDIIHSNLSPLLRTPLGLSSAVRNSEASVVLKINF